jgi:hypothetical protein
MDERGVKSDNETGVVEPHQERAHRLETNNAREAAPRARQTNQNQEVQFAQDGKRRAAMPPVAQAQRRVRARV